MVPYNMSVRVVEFGTYSPAFADIYAPTNGERTDGQAELTWVAGYTYQNGLPHPQTVTHPSTNRSRRRATTLIEIGVLLLS